MKKIRGVLIISVLIFLIPLSSFAHTPILMCEEDDGNCECRGMFSDMSTAGGADIIVKDDSGRVILKGKTNRDGEFLFPIPNTHYTVIMSAGPGHETDPWDSRDEY